MISNTPFNTRLTWAGTNWQQFNKLDSETQKTYYCSRIRRSLKRLAARPTSPLNKLYGRVKEGAKFRASNLIILPNMVDTTVSIYNGKIYERVKVTSNMVGQYLGCFRDTRKLPKHTGVAKKKVAKGKKG